MAFVENMGVERSFTWMIRKILEEKLPLGDFRLLIFSPSSAINLFYNSLSFYLQSNYFYCFFKLPYAIFSSVSQ